MKFESPFANADVLELAKKQIIKRIEDYNLGIKKITPGENDIDHLLEYLRRMK